MFLAFETSCDDSAVALLSQDGQVLSHKLATQIKQHAKYGGVVPEIASRRHLTNLPLILNVIQEEYPFSLDELTAVVATNAPGLVGSLLIGLSYAKTIAWLTKKPLLVVDHLEGHLLAPFLSHTDLCFPYLALIASGGHTHLILANDLGDYRLLGRTLDDALGEAFDKVAKMLGLEYPGGPIIEKLADLNTEPLLPLPMPLQKEKTLNFSFSGLKTAIRKIIVERDLYNEKNKLLSLSQFLAQADLETKRKTCQIAASFQDLACRIVEQRFTQACKQTNVRQIALTGGVACNKKLRETLQNFANKKNLKFFAPQPSYCTDNAAMIGFSAYMNYKRNIIMPVNPLTANVSSKSKISSLPISI